MSTTADSQATQQLSALTACNTCSATLAAEQRYCVTCGARNPVAADPAASHLASATRDSRMVAAARRTGATKRKTPLVAALLVGLPLALAVGVLLGRGSADDELAKALRNRPAPIVQVGGGGAAASTAAGGSSSTAQVAPVRRTVTKVLAQSGAGPINDVISYRPSASKKASDISKVKQCARLKGTAYLQCGKTLPDIVGTGTGGGSDGAPSGSGD